MQQNTLIRLKEILKIIPVSKTAWYQGIKDGVYPQPIKLGERISAWRSSDIQAIVNQDSHS